MTSNPGTSASDGRLNPADLPDDDVVRILLEQHARVRQLFGQIGAAPGEGRREAFDELRALLAAHETAEELVLRPVSRQVAGAEVTDARNQEEREATRMLAELERLDAASPEFAARLPEFEATVLRHAEQEELQEFPAVVAQRDAGERARLGQVLRAAERVGPTHPHPSTAGSPGAQLAFGPMASLLDQARDAYKRLTSG